MSVTTLPLHKELSRSVLDAWLPCTTPWIPWIPPGFAARRPRLGLCDRTSPKALEETLALLSRKRSQKKRRGEERRGERREERGERREERGERREERGEKRDERRERREERGERREERGERRAERGERRGAGAGAGEESSAFLVSVLFYIILGLLVLLFLIANVVPSSKARSP